MSSSSSVCQIPEAQKDIKKMDEVGWHGNQPGGPCFYLSLPCFPLAETADFFLQGKNMLL